LYNPLCRLMSRPLQHSPRLSQPYCVLHTAPGSASGGHFSKGLAGYNIDNVQHPSYGDKGTRIFPLRTTRLMKGSLKIPCS
jgi:hypothetical protein